MSTESEAAEPEVAESVVVEPEAVESEVAEPVVVEDHDPVIDSDEASSAVSKGTDELNTVTEGVAPQTKAKKKNKPHKKSSTLKKIKSDEGEESKKIDENVEPTVKTKKESDETVELGSENNFSIESIDEPIAYDVLTFYKQPVRKLYIKKKLYFVLEDIISLTGTLDLLPYISRFKKSNEYQKNVSQYIVSVPILVNEKDEVVDCIASNGCSWLIEVLRYNQRFFPGPFPSWIARIE